MFKKAISFILALLIFTAAFSAAPLTASAEDTPAEPEAESIKTGNISSDSDIASVGYMYDSGFEYELLDDGTAKITGSQSSSIPEEVTVPASLGGHKVTEIGTLVFRFYTNITKIILPDGLKVIDSYASSGCSNLTEVVIPDSVTTIGEGAFYGSPKLTEVEIPAGVTEIGPLAFGWYWDSSAEDDVKISDLNIRGKSGTAAEKYAKDNGFGFTDISAAPLTASAEVYSVELSGVKSDSVGLNNYGYCCPIHPVYSYIIQENNSSFTRVQCVSDYFSDEVSKIVVENYSLDGKTLNSTRSIPFELTLFGGFYSGSKYNFFVFGDKNLSEDNNKEVFRVVKYSKDWDRLGQTSFYGENTYIPFWAGSLRMTENSGRLYIHTCHTMYMVRGKNHQANVTLVVNEEDNSIISSVTDVEWYSTGYVSHSFNQFIETDGTDIFRVNHGDAYPARGIIIAKNPVNGGVRNSAYTVAVNYSKTGAVGENWTGFELGGFELSDKNCLIAGKTVNYQDYDTAPNNTKNIFICVTDKNLSGSTVKMLTNYTDSDWFVANPQLIKLSDSRFAVFWEEKYPDTGEYDDIRVRSAKYTIIDGNGNQLTPVYSYDGEEYYLSDCKPIMCSDGIVRWYGGTNFHNEFGGTRLYMLDPDDPASYGFVSDSQRSQTVSGSVTSYLSKDDVIVELFRETEDMCPVVVLSGGKTDFEFPDVAPGEYTLKVGKKDHVTREYTVTVTDKDVTQDVKLHPVGDVNGDGSVSIADYSRINKHVCKVKPLSGYEFKCADVNGDGNVSIADLSRVNKHVCKVKKLW